ncbi:copine (calcium-dependent phospholipid-binding protein) family [Actinidia rufa]|uniref:Copine (Calcium-dependent phospholipid-binding protein) family n=1 Tax=Actinidia rufa TaxID=165716 RepID=A0A7J0EXX3_9ERIC|nr:copine (calcium-dependent phospholipid-binding protein) family [Actinidia rufa]
MGNSESIPDDTHDDFPHQPPSYEDNHPPYHPPSHADDHPPSDAGSSMNRSYQRKQLAPYIADNYNSLDEVLGGSHVGQVSAQVVSVIVTSACIRDDYLSHKSLDGNWLQLEKHRGRKYDKVIVALREAGLESSNLILGIDFTKSNEWTGKHSFNRKSLHAIGSTPNPYEQAISIIGRTLSPFDEDNLIPCFGFGDASTHDQNVFSFYADNRYCNGFEEALVRYREIVPYIKLSGPTSFAPIIDAGIDIVERSNGQYHVLVIIADGQVTRSPDTPPGRFSPQEQATVNSIVTASQYPLSIILVGVGDGPWDAMKQFDDNIPHRAFDNFQFVNFTKIMSENTDTSKKEAAFALAALMEIPSQYRATINRPYTDRNLGAVWARPLPPPREVIDHDDAVKSIPHMSNFESVDKTPEEQACPICLTNSKDMAFGCGHLTCKDCGGTISSCPLCRKPITTRIRLYS